MGTIFEGGGSARLLEGPYAIHYGHVSGDFVPANGNAHVADLATSPLGAPAVVDLEPGGLAGDFTQGGLAFPEDAAQRGVIALRDVETGDLVELGSTDDGRP